MLLASCNQDVVEPDNTETTYSIESRGGEPTLTDDGLLHFRTREHFEAYMHRLERYGTSSLTTLSQRNGFQSLKNNPGLDRRGILLEDQTFSSVLNKDAAISIGDYIFKLNPATEEVYVIKSTTNERERGMTLSARTDNNLPASAEVLSFDDEVLSIMEADLIGGPDVDIEELFWNRCDAAQRQARESADVCSRQIALDTGSCTFLGTVRAKYGGFGIWYRLTASVFHSVDPNCVWSRFLIPADLATNFEITYEGTWNPCGHAGEATTSNVTQGSGLSMERVLYSGTRRLKTYEMSASATLNCAGNIPINTGVATING